MELPDSKSVARPERDAICDKPPSRRYTQGLFFLIALVMVVPILLYAGRNWITATTGIGALLLAVAPCLIMCAIGLCASRAAKRNDSTSASKGSRESDGIPDTTAVQDKHQASSGRSSTVGKLE